MIIILKKTQNYLDNAIILNGNINEKPILLKNKDLIIDGGSEIIFGDESLSPKEWLSNNK